MFITLSEHSACSMGLSTTNTCYKKMRHNFFEWLKARVPLLNVVFLTLTEDVRQVLRWGKARTRDFQTDIAHTECILSIIQKTDLKSLLMIRLSVKVAGVFSTLYFVKHEIFGVCLAKIRILC